jgi:hypothetical protein
LYVALRAAVGLQVIEWIREAAAAEEFEWRGRRRKIVPDALVVVADNDCECRAFVEIDLGSGESSASCGTPSRHGVWSPRATSSLRK